MSCNLTILPPIFVLLFCTQNFTSRALTSHYLAFVFWFLQKCSMKPLMIVHVFKAVRKKKKKRTQKSCSMLHRFLLHAHYDLTSFALLLFLSLVQTFTLAELNFVFQLAAFNMLLTHWFCLRNMGTARAVKILD